MHLAIPEQLSNTEIFFYLLHPVDAKQGHLKKIFLIEV